MRHCSGIFSTNCTHVHHSLQTDILAVEGFGLGKSWSTACLFWMYLPITSCSCEKRTRLSPLFHTASDRKHYRAKLRKPWNEASNMCLKELPWAPRRTRYLQCISRDAEWLTFHLPVGIISVERWFHSCEEQGNSSSMFKIFLCLV